MTDSRAVELLARLDGIATAEFELGMAMEVHSLPLRLSLDRLVDEGLAQHEIVNRHRLYSLSPQGQRLVDQMKEEGHGRRDHRRNRNQP